MEERPALIEFRSTKFFQIANASRLHNRDYMRREEMHNDSVELNKLAGSFFA